MKNLEGWPEGTTKKTRSDGKKEIVLPTPTDMAEFDKEQELARPKKEKEEPQPAHWGRDKATREARLQEIDDNFPGKKRAIVNTRQARVNQEIRKARRGKEEYQDRKMAA